MTLPRLLNDSLGEVCKLHPSALSAAIKLTPPSTASMNLPEGEPTIGVRRWVEVYGPDGSLGIYRARSPSSSPGTEQRVKLEHGIVTLEDSLTPVETTLTGSLKSIASNLMGYQTTAWWRLGDAPEGGSYTLEVNETNLLKALLDAVKLADGYRMTFDQSNLPWTVNIVAMSSTPMCECRLHRNMVGVSITTDDSDLCTRAVSTALPGGYLDADTIGSWGVVAKPLGIPEDTPSAEALSYAREYLEPRKNPAVSIEVDALHMAEQTGEALDLFHVGELCRVALPDYGIVTDERIISIGFNDLLSACSRVKLTLSAPVRDASRRLAKLNSESSNLKSETTSLGTTSRRHGASLQQQAAELEKTYEYTQTVEGNLTSYQNYVGIKLDEQQAKIDLKASQTVVDALGNRVSSAEIAIDGANAEIALKVNKNGVISSINQTAESIRIQASRINLEGYVTASQLSAEIATIQNNISAQVATTALYANSASIGYMTLNGQYISASSATVVTSVSYRTSTIHYDFGANSYSVKVVTSVSYDTTTIDYLRH